MTALATLPLLTHGSDEWGHGWWPLWPILWFVVIGTVVWLIVRRRPRRHDPLDRAREVLAERYARGELTSEEYRARLDGLRVDPR
jgi:putative membrane protein